MLNGCLGRQLPLLEDVAEVLADRCDRDLVQLRELLLGEPDGSFEEPHLEARQSILGLVEDELGRLRRRERTGLFPAMIPA